MRTERAKQIMGLVAFQGIKRVAHSDRVSETAAEILNLAVEANAFMLTHRGSEAYDGNPSFQRLLALDEPDNFKRCLHYAYMERN
jgi:hypothetical protein